MASTLRGRLAEHHSDARRSPYDCAALVLGSLVAVPFVCWATNPQQVAPVGRVQLTGVSAAFRATGRLYCAGASVLTIFNGEAAAHRANIAKISATAAGGRFHRKPGSPAPDARARLAGETAGLKLAAFLALPPGPRHSSASLERVGHHPVLSMRSAKAAALRWWLWDPAFPKPWWPPRRDWRRPSPPSSPTTFSSTACTGWKATCRPSSRNSCRSSKRQWWRRKCGRRTDTCHSSTDERTRPW